MGQPSIYDPVGTKPAGCRPELKTRSAVTALIAVCLSMAVIVIWETWSSRQYHLHDKEVAMSNLAQTLASQAQAAIKQADTLLFTWSTAWRTTVWSRGRLNRLQRLLGAQRREVEPGAWAVRL